MKRWILLKLMLLLLVGLTGGAWAKTVTLAWDASPSDVSGYKIYYKAGSSELPFNGTGAAEGSSPIDVGKVLTYSINSLPGDQDHYFAVTAYDAAGNESGYSNSVLSPIISGGGGGGANNPPQLAPIGTKSVGEGAPLSFSVSGSDSDNDQLAYSAGNLPNGASFNAATRQFSWTPDFEQGENTRIYSVTFSVSDGAASDSETVTINVTNINRAPVLASIGNKALAEGDSLNIVVAATDPDANPLTYSASNLPSGAVFIPSTRSFSWIPAADQAGSYAVTFSVTDGSMSDSETVTLSVSNGNEAPLLDAIGAKNIAENSRLSFTVSASDANSDSLTYSAAGLPAGASFDAGQQIFSWTPDFSQAGNYSATFNVTDGTQSDSETINITVTNTNRLPTISGAPATSVMAGTGYSFVPTASDADGDTLTFSISNKPAWASFAPASGQLSGTPGEQNIGSSAVIGISVSDGTATAALASLVIEVQAYAAQDSDGDGVLDSLDPFPNDSSEWLDTDGDQLGNNADLDDDNDGIVDTEDGFPLDADQTGWVITATAGAGGFISPEGETSVVYGGSQSYTLTPKAGYAVNDLLVDNVSAGMVTSYRFENVGAHHSIEAVYAPLPSGLSVATDTAGLDAVERSDGGDERNNLVDGKPKLDLDYVYQVVLRDSVAASERRVFLHMDGYRYEMQLESGALESGAVYAFTTRMGPAFRHQFYFTAEDSTGALLYRYPQSGDLDGPTVALLDGKNVIAISADVDNAALDSQGAFNVAQVYRWLPEEKLNGSYQKVDDGGPVIVGEGYVLKRTADDTLPDLDGYGDIAATTHEIKVQPGWNLIANPYKGNVSLADVQVRHGGSAPVSWLTAVNSNFVVDGVSCYLGKDWGNSYAFESAAGPQSAVLTPWIGYWIYSNPTDQQLSLLIPKPRQ